MSERIVAQDGSLESAPVAAAELAADQDRAMRPSMTNARKPEKASRDRGLFLIGIFKLLKSAFFFCIGLGAIHLMDKDLGDEVMRLAHALRFDPESRVVALILDKVDLIDASRLRQIGFATFAYSALALTEGVGLLLERPWAEYLTLGLTISFLPWELFELARRPDWLRLGLLLLNLAVLWYLVWLLKRKRLRSRSENLVTQ